MKKRLTCIALILCVFPVSVLSGCNYSGATKDSFSIENVYGAEEFAAEAVEMSRKKEGNVAFAQNGKGLFPVVYPSVIDASDDETPETSDIAVSDKKALKNAVNFFADTLSEIVGDEFIAIPDNEFLSGKAFRLVLDKSLTDFTDDGFKLVIAPENITVTANSYTGLEYGIYTFLEDYLGCIFATEEFDYIPNYPEINLASTEKTYIPDVKWRAVYAYESLPLGITDGHGLQWSQKLKLNGAGNRGWFKWAHSFYYYISPEEYIDTHPEYFSEYNGKRKYEDGPVSGQLCLTNEDVYRIVSEKMFALMAKNPQMRYWDFSQMDTWINRGTGCRCVNCKRLDDREESPMGSLLTFINRLADECAERFPQNFISTLAYNYSATPPKTIRPRDNVIIKLCLMPGDVASPVGEPRNAKAETSKKIIEEWGAISKNLLIWDYNINYHQYLMPYPILTALKDNNDFYIDHNVYAIFHQLGRDKGGNSAELSAYVFSKLMWNRDTDVEKLLSRYFGAVYGDAAEPMARYYNALEQNAYAANRPLYIYSTVFENTFDYLSNANVAKYLEMFQAAENAVINQPEILKRVKKAKIGVLYVKAQEISFDLKGKQAALEEWKTLCDEFGIDSLYEGNPKKDNEVNTFYNQQKILINAIPWICVGAVLVLASIVLVIVFVVKKTKQRKRLRKQKTEV